VILLILLALCAGCRQLPTQSSKPSSETVPSPTPLAEPPADQIPPVPASEARFRGFSPPKRLLRPVEEPAIETVDHAENIERAERSAKTDPGDSDELTIPHSELPVPPPVDVPDGPVADFASPFVEPLEASPLAEIDLSEFLAELNLEPPASTPSPAPNLVQNGPFPVVAPLPVARHGAVEEWPRQGLPWNVVVTPAAVPQPRKTPAGPLLPATPRLAFENSSWADEPIE
jgi:hypothetical protein